MNVSCDSHDQLSPIQKKRIKTRTWYVKFMLQVSDVIDDPDFDVAQILDASDQERNIRTSADVSFSYDAEHLSTNGTEIWPDLFTQLIRFGIVLWSPLYEIQKSLTCIGSQSQSNPADSAINGNMK